MSVLWLADALLAVVVVPLVVILLLGVLRAAIAIDRNVSAIREAAPILLADLAPVPQLLRTQALVHETVAGLARYGAALDRIL
jgi:hypothetical protein